MIRSKYFIVGIIFIGMMLPLSAHGAKAIGKITGLTGTAQIVREAVPSPITVTLGRPVHLRDRVRTGADSRLRIELIDGSILTLGERTDITLDQFEFVPEKKKRSAFFGIALGKLRIFARDLLKFKERDFKVRTPTAVLGVRGSLFLVWVTKVDSTIATMVVCFEGYGQVTSDYDPSQFVDLRAGNATDVIGPNPPTKPVLLTQEQLDQL
ncbi:MAG: FecR domain-containing protein, partial [Desulfobacterales bacterium]|nr:FecR domain-containing protein [Desulfobacterales bacterium]